MLPFRVIQIEQHRALPQNAAKLYLLKSFSPIGLLLNAEFARANQQIPDFLSRFDFAALTLKIPGTRRWKMKRFFKVVAPLLTEARLKPYVIDNKGVRSV
jgi:hypothetical protein